MYIAGIHLSHAQGIESIVTASTIATIAVIVRDQRRTFRKASKEGGNITAGPESFFERIVTPIHGSALLLAPFSYLVAVLSNRMEQPEWYERTAFDFPLSVGPLAWTRTAAAVGLLGTAWMARAILKSLGKQLHFIGTREKGEVVSTGPYSVVRHPLYSLALGQFIFASVAYWSWIPLVSFGICLGAFAYKIPVEERLMEHDLAMGPAYLEYKQKVPYKIIPYFW
ncbi:hypothetical protein F5050DRAFT_1421519 [Lentinula boryana]|uniref:Protein-S-isoprenylcysteine O-methyltransferase n=1 Tax=Lentinula boryana TaxID=40481 RepID=A0ABQ8QFZ9_9AGAR|nr:hypothetical protein F5050DRAFT_1421519 [Lentinula boryana]